MSRGLHEALCQDLAGTGVQSCDVVFGRIDSEYFAHNPGVVEKMPGISKTIRTISEAECARNRLRRSATLTASHRSNHASAVLFDFSGYAPNDSLVVARDRTEIDLTEVMKREILQR